MTAIEQIIDNRPFEKVEDFLFNENIKDYDKQIDDYLSKHLNIRNCKINFKETGAIPLFRQKNVSKSNEIYIGSAGGMTRLSTGYTFLNIQEQSRYIRENVENIKILNHMVNYLVFVHLLNLK